MPIHTQGDGNCLFRSLSQCLYGYEDAHLALRLLAAIEVGLHPEVYGVDSPTRHELLRHDLIVCPSYVEAFSELTIPGAYSCVIGIIAVSSAVAVACDSVYPPGLSDLPSPLTTTIRGRTDCGDRSISLLWTTTDNVPPAGNVEINHFVPLLARRPYAVASGDQPVVTDSDSADHAAIPAVSKTSDQRSQKRRRQQEENNATDAAECDIRDCGDADNVAEPAVGTTSQRPRKRHRRFRRQQQQNCRPTEQSPDNDVAPDADIRDDDGGSLRPTDDDNCAVNDCTDGNDISRFSENVDMESSAVADAIEDDSEDRHLSVSIQNHDKHTLFFQLLSSKLSR